LELLEHDSGAGFPGAPVATLIAPERDERAARRSLFEPLAA